MKRMILSGALFMATTLATAIPAKPGLWRTLKMSDGTEVRVQRQGDEHARFWQSEDGRRFVATSEGYVEASEGEIAARQARRRAPLAASRARKSPRRVTMGERTSYTGKKKGIVILVQYTDVEFKTANDLARYKRILNEEGYNVGRFKGSVADYFKAQSRGLFELDFDVVGPYTLAHNQKYYGGNNYYGEDKAPEEMIVEACRQADAEVDFRDYDWDGDGYVDQVFVLYAGKGEADSYDENSVWPHMYELSATGKRLKLDGVTIDTYACSNEVDMTGNIEGIGAFCHEFSHCMGFPDFYDTSYNGNFGMSQFDLMDMGSYNGDGFQPAGYSAHEKMMCGWQEPIELADEEVSIENLAALSEGGASYIIYNKAHPDEYYMLENRQRTGWDAGLPSRGLMITHVDFDKAIWQDNTPNTTVTAADVRNYGYSKTNDHQRCTIFHADNNDDSRYWNSSYGGYTRQTLANDLYPYSTNNTLSNTSAPAATLYNANTDGTRFMNIAITEITRNSDGTVSFRFAPVTEEEKEEPKGDYLFYESFDQCEGKGGNDGAWSGMVAAAQFKPDNEGWEAAKAYGADQCAKFGTTSVPATVTTPTIALDGEARLTFRVGTWNATRDIEGLELSIEGGTLSATTFETLKGEWSDCEATVTSTDQLRITFTAKGRMFLDEVMLVQTTDGPGDGIEAPKRVGEQGIVYDLSGRRLSAQGTTRSSQPLRKGLYIQGGRKFIVR